MGVEDGLEDGGTSTGVEGFVKPAVTSSGLCEGGTSVVVAVSIMGTELPAGLELAGVVSLDKSVGVAGATGTAEPDVLTLLSDASLKLVPVLDGAGTGCTEDGVVTSWLDSVGVAGRDVVSRSVGWGTGTGVDS